MKKSLQRFLVLSIAMGEVLNTDEPDVYPHQYQFLFRRSGLCGYLVLAGLA